MKDLWLARVCLLALPALAVAGEKGADVSPALSQEHMNESRSVRFRTPPDWTVESRGRVPELTEARGGGLIVRMLWREGELGLDSLHVDCMLVRLAPEMESRPKVDYEYDFVGSTVAGRRALDSAFVVRYDQPIDQFRDWRQRNLTVVGTGESLCVIGYSPLPVWKKSKAARRLLDAVMGSVELRPWR